MSLPSSINDREWQKFTLNYNDEPSVNTVSNVLRSGDTELVTNAVDLTGDWATVASINVTGYNRLGLFVSSVLNDSEDGELRILGVDGSDSYLIDGVSNKSLFSTGDDVKTYYEFDVGTLEDINVQVKVGTVGATAGTVTIKINKMYRC
jgi:hypothetical protein